MAGGDTIPHTTTAGTCTTWSNWSAESSYTTATSSSITNSIWIDWNSVDKSGSISVLANGTTVWRNWVFSCADTAITVTGTPAATIASTTWVVWNEQIHDGRGIVSISSPSQEDREAVAERQEQYAEERRQIEERGKKLQEEKDAAEVRAKGLLMDLIGEDELRVYEETGRLFVRGRKNDYIVQKEGLVKKVSKDKIADLCVHLENRWKYPSTDNVIALKLAIEGDENRVLKLANVHGSYDRPEELPLAANM